MQDIGDNKLANQKILFALELMNRFDKELQPLDKAHALKKIAVVLKDFGQTEGSEKVLLQVYDITNKITANENNTVIENKVHFLSDVSTIYALLGHENRAVVIVMQAIEISKTIQDKKIKSRQVFSEGQASIANALATLGKYTLALKFANKINNVYYKNKALMKIADSYEKSNQFKEVVETIRLIENKTDQLDELVAFLANNIDQDEKKATQTLIKLTKVYKNVKERSEALVKATRVLIQSNKTTSAKTLLTEANKIAKNIKNAETKAQVFTKIAREYLKLNQTKQIEPLLLQAFESAKSIDKVADKDTAIKNIAVQYAEAGQFNQALQMVSNINDAGDKIKVLQEVAKQYAKTEQKLDKADNLILREIVHSLVSIKQFWQQRLIKAEEL